MAGLNVRPICFNYHPESAAKHPWLDFRPYTSACGRATPTNGAFSRRIKHLGTGRVLGANGYTHQPLMHPLHIEPLQLGHLDALATVLLCPEVYAHIEDTVPAKDVFVLGLQRALAGPGAANSADKWLNFLVRDAGGSMLGRLEATVHDNLAEVAFLFGPQYWGQGWASAGLQWLHGEVLRTTGVAGFWATTTPANIRSQRLLMRCGYSLAAPPAVALYSWEPGDLVFHYHCTGSPSV